MDKVKIGFIGAGGIANAHLNNLARMKDVEITALCDIVKEKAETAAQKFGGRVYLDYRRMLDREKLDALYICVPPFAHQDQEILACQKKIPFFVEKPVALSLEKAQKIEAQVKKSGVITSVGYVLRYMDIVKRTAQILSGRSPGLITGSYYGEVPGADWLIKKDRGGGQLVEQATHIVNLMLFFGGVHGKILINLWKGCKHLSRKNSTWHMVLGKIRGYAGGSLCTMYQVLYWAFSSALKRQVDQKKSSQENAFFHGVRGERKHDPEVIVP